MAVFLALALAGAVQTAPAAPTTLDTPVLSRSVEKGEMLGAADFTTAPLPTAHARGALPPDRAVGQEASRRLQAGAAVRAADIIAPRIIKRGQAVTILVQDGPLTIAAAGRALSDAAVGAPVRVLNLGSNRTLDAIADASGRARILTP